ncbi:hypothetical protein CLOM_g2888 [Closterium sp. NIES-68]|nr:hypothetical protein CLOM_g2888 [Closterium sp. NIES-68]GJP69459.1 hypothetical protein CLOP_g472 [Closterium sp. NIES-67]
MTPEREAAPGGEVATGREVVPGKQVLSEPAASTAARHILRFSLQCLRILAALDPVPATEPEPPGSTVPGSAVPGSANTDLLAAVGGSELIPFLLDLLHELGPPVVTPPTAPAAEASPRAAGLSREQVTGPAAVRPAVMAALYPCCNPYPGYRRDVVAVIANACHRRKANQDAVRLYSAPLSIPSSAAAVDSPATDRTATTTPATTDSTNNSSTTTTSATTSTQTTPTPPNPPSSSIMSSGLFLILQQCVAGDSRLGDDLLREWGLWAVRNLLEANPENAADVAALEVRGGAQTDGLREMGLAVEVDGRTGRPKLRNLGADER